MYSFLRINIHRISDISASHGDEYEDGDVSDVLAAFIVSAMRPQNFYQTAPRNKPGDNHE
jgi:hypothetical protein